MQPVGNSIRFGPYALDLRSGELVEGDRRIQLQDKAFRVLARLLERPSEVVLREELRAALWPDGTYVDFEHGLNMAVKRLRTVLRDSAERPHFIETVPRRGYRFVGTIKERRATDSIVTSPPNNLPVQLTRFIGRERELAELRERLSVTRLVTLTGAGGCGKTRLAVELAGQLSREYAQGVWFVDLSRVPSQEGVADAVARALEADPHAGRPIVETIVDHVRHSEMVVVLDNCEHVVAACAELTNRLLEVAPSLRIIATSREALGLASEMTMRVPSLSVPESKDEFSNEALSKYEAVQLFIDRAQLKQPDFQVTEENAQAVTEICSRLDGIPLAIELAVGRLGVLTVHQIAGRVGDRFRLLTGGSRTALPRHQTLRALIDWSYDLLNEGEQTVLRRLAVFSGGFDLEAAEAVCHDDQADTTNVLDCLQALVAKSLVAMSDLHGRARYSMLETIRQHATEKLLESGEMTRLCGRHFDFFLEIAESEAQKSFRRAPVSLIRNRENLAAALAWRTSESPVPPSALRLAAALVVRFDPHLGFCQIIEPLLARALEAEGNDKARACLLNSMGWYSASEGRLDEARGRHSQALRVAHRAGNLVEQARAMAGQAKLAALETARDQAIALLDGAIKLAQSADTPDLEVAFRTSRSELLFDDRARRRGFEEAFRIAREYKFPQIQQAGSRLVNDALESGDCAAAARLTKMICTTLSEISDDGLSEMWSAEAALFALGDLEPATEFIAAAEGRGLEAQGHLLALRAHIADRMGHDVEARTLWQRVASHAQGRVPHFERYRLIKAAEWAMDHGESAWAASLIDQFGAHIAHSQSQLAAIQLDAARARLYRTIRHPDADSAHRRVFERLRPGMDINEAWLILAVAYHAAFAGTDGPVADALDSLIDWGRQHETRLLMAKAVDARAEIEWTRGNVQAAARRHEQAIHIAEEIDIPAEKAAYVHDLGRVALASGDIATAAQRANEALGVHRIYETRGGLAAAVALTGALVSDPTEAGFLLGCAERWWRRLGIRHRRYIDDHARAVERARAANPDTFETAYARGLQGSIDEAAETARRALDSLSRGSRTSQRASRQHRQELRPRNVAHAAARRKH